MGWRNQKNWMEHVPALEPAEVARWTEQLKDLDKPVFISLVPDVDLKEERVYMRRDVLSDFKEFLKQAQTTAVRVLSIEQLEEGKKGHVFKTCDPFLDPLDPATIYWVVPCVDFRLAVAEATKEIDERLKERERLRRLRDDLLNLGKVAADYSTKAQREADFILRSIPAIAKVAHQAQKKLGTIREEHVDRLLKTWDKVEIFSGQEEKTSTLDHLLLRVTKDPLIMQYHTERARNLHKSLDGIKVTLGRFMVDVGFVNSSITAGLVNHAMHFTIYGIKPDSRTAFLHPHIQAISQNEYDRALKMHRGSCCLGSYSDTLKQACETVNVVLLLDTIYDYLTSCSESGWYTNFQPWLSPEVKAQYCSCLRTNWEKDKVDICSGCGSKKGA